MPTKPYLRTTPNRYNTIRELRIQNNTQDLVKLVQRMSKQINQRFYRLEHATGTGSGGYQRAQRITGKEKPRFSTSENVISSMHPDELYRTAHRLNELLTRSDTHITGYRDIIDERLTQGVKQLRDRWNVNITAEEFKEFLDIGGAEFLNSKHLDSAQIVEDFVEFTKGGNISGKEFLREFKRYRKQLAKLDEDSEAKPFDYGKVRRNLIKLDERKAKKKRK